VCVCGVSVCVVYAGGRGCMADRSERGHPGAAAAATAVIIVLVRVSECGVAIASRGKGWEIKR